MDGRLSSLKALAKWRISPLPNLGKNSHKPIKNTRNMDIRPGLTPGMKEGFSSLRRVSALPGRSSMKTRPSLSLRKGNEMIVRMWHGRVPTSKAKAYREFTIARAIPDYQSVEGNLSVHVLERTEGDVTHFMTLTFWKDLDSIKGFAGEEVEAAKYYPEDKDFLLEFEPKVLHYEVVGQS